MSKIFEALQKAQADRAAAGTAPGDTGRADDATAPAARLVWWRGLAVGVVLALGTTLFAFAYVVSSRRAAAPLSPPPADDATRSRVLPRENERPTGGGEGAFAPAPAQLPAPQDTPFTDGGHALAPAVTAAVAADDAARVVRTQEPAAPAASPVAASPHGFWVQLGAFRDRANAERMLPEIGAGYGSVIVHPGRSAEAPWTVRVGRFPDRHAAEAAQRRLVRDGRQGFVVRD